MISKIFAPAFDTKSCFRAGCVGVKRLFCSGFFLSCEALESGAINVKQSRKELIRRTSLAFLYFMTCDLTRIQVVSVTTGCLKKTPSGVWFGVG